VTAPALKPFPANLTIQQQVDLLTRPETNPTRYAPFEHAASYPFRPNATAWSRVNAWWLAESAWLAYWHDAAAVQSVHDRRQTGLTTQLIDAGGTQCYLTSSDDFAIVAFRGTQPDAWPDVFADVDFPPVPWTEHGLRAYVDQGFMKTLNAVGGPLDEAIHGLMPGCRLWFTGHSLGAAIATLAASRYQSATAGIYTFGSPLVGNQSFAAAFNASYHDGMMSRSFRYMNDHDVVTHVPSGPLAFPHGRFTHVDEARWITGDGNVGTQFLNPTNIVQDVFGTPRFLLHTINEGMAARLPAIPDALTDHTPLYYVLHTWNDLAKYFPVDG
jgi:triacylglycerol lipase